MKNKQNAYQHTKVLFKIILINFQIFLKKEKKNMANKTKLEYFRL